MFSLWKHNKPDTRVFIVKTRSSFFTYGREYILFVYHAHERVLSDTQTTSIMPAHGYLHGYVNVGMFAGSATAHSYEPTV